MSSNPPEGGLCVGQPVQWWFPDLITRNPREIRMQMKANAEKALIICNHCQVKDPCREYALEWEMHGIWGGMTERERKEYRLLHNIAFKRPRLVDVVGSADA